MITESWFRRWFIALTAGMLLGAIAYSKELKYLPIVVPFVVVSFFHPVIDEQAAIAGKKTVDWLANKSRK
jgi:hypothetical protein